MNERTMFEKTRFETTLFGTPFDRRTARPRTGGPVSPREEARPAPSQRDARLRRAARDVGRGRMERALRGYLGLAREAPSDVQQLNRTGDLLVRARQVNAGIELFLRAAHAYEQEGFEAKARAIYQKILRIAPEQPEARERLQRLSQAQ